MKNINSPQNKLISNPNPKFFDDPDNNKTI